jgi:hypothetical protein
VGEEKKADVGAARVAAIENAKTPAGQRYEVALEAAVDRWLKKAVERCLRDSEKSAQSDFEAFVRVAGDGAAEEVLFGAETPVARCVEPDFREATYPRPPRPSWWIAVEVRLR